MDSRVTDNRRPERALVNPNDKVALYRVGVGSYEAQETHKEANLNHLPCHTLFDLARNESAPIEWRKAATELLIDKHCLQASHPELRELVKEIRVERVSSPKAHTDN